MKNLFLLSTVLLAMTVIAGCNGNSKPVEEKSKSVMSSDPSDGADGHAHGDGKGLVWEMKEKMGQSKYDVWYGHFGSHFHGGDKIKPVVAITLNGEPVTDAKVYNALIDPRDSGKMVTDPAEMIYQAAANDQIALYGGTEQTIPLDASQCVIRYQVGIAGQQEHTVDVTISVGH